MVIQVVNFKWYHGMAFSLLLHIMCSTSHCWYTDKFGKIYGTKDNPNKVKEGYDEIQQLN